MDTTLHYYDETNQAPAKAINLSWGFVATLFALALLWVLLGVAAFVAWIVCLGKNGTVSEHLRSE